MKKKLVLDERQEEERNKGVYTTDDSRVSVFIDNGFVLDVLCAVCVSALQGKERGWGNQNQNQNQNMKRKEKEKKKF